jgi:hypothetical protein
VTSSAEDPAVVELRGCLHEHARDLARLQEAVMRCASEARDRLLPPEALIKVVREELPALAARHQFDVWQVKHQIIEWLLTAYYGPKNERPTTP